VEGDAVNRNLPTGLCTFPVAVFKQVISLTSNQDGSRLGMPQPHHPIPETSSLTHPGSLRKTSVKPNVTQAMTKGHNQDKNKSEQKPEAKHKGGQEGHRSLSDQQKNKDPNQGRNKGDQSGGTKGQNAI
jgi:hypothetical protein